MDKRWGMRVVGDVDHLIQETMYGRIFTTEMIFKKCFKAPAFERILRIIVTDGKHRGQPC